MRKGARSKVHGSLSGAMVTMCLLGCGGKNPAPASENGRSESSIHIQKGDGSIEIKTPQAEFLISQQGYVTGRLLVEGQTLTLDGSTGAPGLSVTLNGEELNDFRFDLSKAQLSPTQGQIGGKGRRVDLQGRSPQASLEATLEVEVYEDFPQVAFLSASFRNAGSRDVGLNTVDLDEHLLDARLVDPSVEPYQMWSFHGASIEWGKDNVFEIPRKFSQTNQMGSLVEVKGDLGRVGGGIPVVATWTRAVGEAIGHSETLPLVLSIPVETETDGRVHMFLHLSPEETLKPGDTYATPRTFLAVYSGDYYEPLRMYSDILDRQGLTRVTDTDEDYAVSWCGWGYLSDVTPQQMLDTIPKLQEFGIHWATLDDRWFNRYGDWNPRPDTFPDDRIRKMVDQFHSQNIKVQLWWLPLAVEDGGGGYESHRYGVSDVVKEHPDWLVLDQNGQPARMTRNLATLCPAVPAVREYYKQLTERFIKDWGFDGSKLDNIYSVPLCYNPKHHHKSPLDSVYAMGEVYKTIFETTRALKPESVTESCSCGTPPSIAWLRDMDQAVTADPVGSGQVRQRIKMYKALLGPNAAVYGDHVELTRIENPNGNEKDLGSDFASTIGPGGVVGTKFTWPDYGPKLSDVYLTPEKEKVWKKWIGLYNEYLLSRGVFLDLYVYGYDFPEGYAIEKDGVMYYAFFSTVPGKAALPAKWSGAVELRGLAPGKYGVTDYVNNQDLGTVNGPDARLSVSFFDHLLLRVVKQ
jgi:alpha-galactosidase